MTEVDVWRKDREKAWLALLLAWVAGFVDAVGYLSLLQLFLAHMSGNSAAMGAYFGQGRWGAAFHRAFPIPMFVLGVAAGAALNEAASRRGVRSLFSLTLGLEAALLAIFMIRGGEINARSAWEFYPLVAPPAVAMGLQNAALRRVGGRTVSTTYVTGMLTSMAEEIVAYFYLRRDRRNRPDDRGATAPRLASLDRVSLLACIWLAFATGAVFGGYAQLRWGVRSLFLPLCGLAVVIVVDLIRPIHAARGGAAGG